MNDLDRWAEKMFPDVKMETSVGDSPVKKSQLRPYSTMVRNMEITFVAPNNEAAAAIATWIGGSTPKLVTTLYSN